ncbi:MAG TPA: hypothetical protein VHO70_06265 [Chitinispirillaceae bacterium]|nr:hypothetical protein [Chitinispirillaceae bacterium]
MQIEISKSEDMPTINTIDGKPVDFKTELKTRISFFQNNQGFTTRKTTGIFLGWQTPHYENNITEQMFSEIFEYHGSDWSTIKFTGATNRAGLPEVTRFFRLKTIADASLYSGLIKGKIVRFIFTLMTITLMVILTVYALSFIPFLRHWITLIFTHLWLFGAVISAYILFVSWKTSSIINCRKKSTLQAFKAAVEKNDPVMAGKMHHFYSDQILGHAKRPLAIFVKDFGALDRFSKDVLLNVLTVSEDDSYSGGLFVCICGNFHCDLFERLNNDQKFKMSALGGKYTVLEMS